MLKRKAVFNWSGGKDSALALLKILESDKFEVISLLTSTNAENGCSSMHGIPSSLLEKQAESIGIPLTQVKVAPGAGMEEYSETMRRTSEMFRKSGVTHFIFGDIFLEDIRRYRENELAKAGLQIVEPLWGKSSSAIEEFLESGLKSVITAADASILGRKHIGSMIDRNFILNLPEGCDPCGENGEYHSFCHDGPLFRHPVRYILSEPEKKSFDDGKYSFWISEISDPEKQI